MALPNVHHPFRSISLPSRIHPPSVKLEAALTQLKLWQTSSSSISTNLDLLGAETLQIGLMNLAELYNCVHELLQSPPVSHGLVHQQNGKLVEDALDGSVTLLDACDAARNIMLTMRGHVLTLQSAFRRKGRSDSTVGIHVNEYFAFRRKAKKEMNSHIAGLKKLESKARFSLISENTDHHLQTVVRVLRDATTFAISMFRSLFLFLSTPSIKTNTCGLSFISKLIPSRSERGRELMNEVQSADLVLNSLREDSGMNVPMAKKMLEAVDDGIQGLEAGLESVFKCLVQNRVSFLNGLTSNC